MKEIIAQIIIQTVRYFDVKVLKILKLDVDISCAPIYARKGARGLLPVKMTKEVSWDNVTWIVKDRSNTELLKLSCGEKCEGSDKMFSFTVEAAGVFDYLVQIRKDGELLECGSKITVILGKIIWMLYNLIMEFNTN